MDIFSILSYLNKISLLAFVVTAIFLGYQFYLLKKESFTNKNKKPIIPDFNENEKIEILNYTKLPAEHQPVMKNDNKQAITFVIGAGLLVLTLTVFIILKSKQTKQTQYVYEPTPTARPVVLISKKPTLKPTIKPTILVNLSPTEKILPSVSPTISPTEVIITLVSPTIISPIPTEKITKELTPTVIASLPTTGIIDQSLIFFGIAFSLIFFAFVF